MFERFNSPQEAYEFKLGAALKMEEEVLEILDESIESAQADRVKQLLQTHRKESEQHVEILEQVFGAFEWEVDDSPCPAIDGHKAEGKANIKKADDSIVDSIILQGAVEVEHHEIGVYQNLILNARAMGRDDVVDLLQQNIRSEEQALEKALALQEQVAAITPQRSAS
jgi:ferritin-like metal-binding protein YciE